MPIIENTDSQTKDSLQQTAEATKKLVKLSKATGRQTKWLIALTIVTIALALILAIPVILDLL